MISIRRRQWSMDAERGLVVSAGEDMPIIRNQVNSGRAVLLRCESDNHSGWVVLRKDGDCEYCIVLGEGSGFAVFAPVIVKALRARGYTIRTHVTRPGLIRLYERLGFKYSETVLRG